MRLKESIKKTNKSAEDKVNDPLHRTWRNVDGRLDLRHQHHIVYKCGVGGKGEGGTAVTTCKFGTRLC